MRKDDVPEAQQPEPGKVISLPRTRSVSWTGVALEGAQQVMAGLWVGGLVVTAGLAVPALLTSIPIPGEASRASLELLGHLAMLGCGLGSLLLLNTLLMHLLTMRSTRAILLQAGLILGMTLIAVAAQAALAPLLSDLMRLNPDLFQRPDADPHLSRFHAIFILYVSLLLVQAMMGVALLLMGSRRWYRYVRIDHIDPSMYVS